MNKYESQWNEIVSEGEVLQLSLKNETSLIKKDYFEIIERKTAELFKVSALTAGILSSSSDEQLKSLENFSTSLGVAFQIQDDILDYYGDESLTGKKLGKDFEEGKFTLPIIIALEELDKENKNNLLSLFKRGGKKDFLKVLDILENGNIFNQMQVIFDLYSKECKKELKKLPNNPYRDALEEIVTNLGSRLT